MPYQIQSNNTELHPKAIELVNQTFGAEGLRMDKAFSQLLGKDNLHQQIIAVSDQQEVCSIASFICFEQKFAQTIFKIGFIGAVCTSSDHQGQGLSTKVLDHLQAQALDHGCDLLLISGGRSLYTRRGAKPLQQFKALHVEKGLPLEQPVFRSLEPFNPELYDLYLSQSLRLELTALQFQQQLSDSCYRIATETQSKLSVLGYENSDGTLEWAVLIGKKDDEVRIIECFGDIPLNSAMAKLSQQLQAKVSAYERNLEQPDLNEPLLDTTLLLLKSPRMLTLAEDHYNADFEQLTDAFVGSSKDANIALLWPNGIFFQ
ncbi:GNAT family N-acetyltransferase [Alginatibacterium sediminis]|uniref:GNAT family N-acetyltransferase n=1 Tax=Alginatibacterium sediminis TaxID=2164068 RepID=A0A420E721_9ALTE|nr:GNAT family N-acetyltransferase [Alginatibacterium sediminis]RKF14254.1 GNAT family N-acetyltransferase [Alginatibacterium sediminis]